MPSETIKGSFTSSTWSSGPTPFADDIPIQAQVCHEVHTFALDDMQGKGYAVYLSCSSADPHIWPFTGYVTFEGTLAGRQGKVVMAASGMYDHAKFSVDWDVLPDTAVDGLKGVKGRGHYVIADCMAKPAKPVQFELTVEY